MSYGRGQMPTPTPAQIGAENQRRALAVASAVKAGVARLYHDSDVALAYEVAKKGARSAHSHRARLDWMIVRERLAAELDRRQEAADYALAREKGIEL